MKKNENGFSIVEIVLVVVVVGLLGAISWIVWDRQQNKKANNGQANTQVNQQEDNQEAPREESTTSKQEFRTYEDDKLLLQYPKDWSDRKEGDQAGLIFFVSPDFKEPEGDGPGPTAAAGYKLQVSVRESESYESYESDLKNAPTAQENHGGFYETIKIDGNNAILSDTKTHGTYIYATTYKNGNTYRFTLHAVDEDKPEVRELFESMLDTVNLK